MTQVMLIESVTTGNFRRTFYDESATKVFRANPAELSSHFRRTDCDESFGAQAFYEFDLAATAYPFGAFGAFVAWSKSLYGTRWRKKATVGVPGKYPPTVAGTPCSP